MRIAFLLVLFILFIVPVMGLFHTNAVQGYSFTVLQKEQLTGCSEDIVKKAFILKNTGNVANVYVLSVENGAVVPQRFSLPSGKEQKFLLAHRPNNGDTTTLSISPLKGKAQLFRLPWHLKNCVDMVLSIPEEITACAEKQAILSYELQNNGKQSEQIEIIFSSLPNETLLLESGATINKTVWFSPAEEVLTVAVHARNKQFTIQRIPIKIVTKCSILRVETVSYNGQSGSVTVQNHGLETATYSFTVAEPENITLTTTALSLSPGAKGDVLFSTQENLTRGEELVLEARYDNTTQMLYAYLDNRQPFIAWERLDAHVSIIGMTILIPLVLSILAFLAVSWKRRERFARFWAATPYDAIDFNHLFDEDEESYPPLLPKKKLPQHLLVFFAGAVLLALGTMGIFSVYPEEAPWIVFFIGGIVLVCAVIVAGVWAAAKKIRFWFVKQRVSGQHPWRKVLKGIVLLLFVISLVVFNKLPETITIPFLDTTISPQQMNNAVLAALGEARAWALKKETWSSPWALRIGGVLVLLVLVGMGKKTILAIRRKQEQRAEIKQAKRLSRKAKKVARKIRSLRKRVMGN